MVTFYQANSIPSWNTVLTVTFIVFVLIYLE